MNIILKGNIIYSEAPARLSVNENGYLVCEDGISKGVFSEVPERYSSFPVKDYGGNIIIPGLCDLHTHAPQYAFRALGMSLELLEWLGTYTYPEESKYADTEYAGKAYDGFVGELARSATTRACIFATVHLPATVGLMEKLESSGLVSYVGLVNMDRNCPDTVRAKSPAQAYGTANEWIKLTHGKYKNTKPILTPRFIPTCSDALMQLLKKLQTQHALPLQSHLSENIGEIEWVRELAPGAATYGRAYERFGLFGGDTKTVMAHCVWCDDEDKKLICDNGVYIAHCPQSNTNLASGIAPVREFLSLGANIGLGTDVAGGANLSVFRALNDAVQVSKLYWRLVDNECKPLSFNEAFYLATLGGGSFFGKVGSFADGYEFDAVVLDDSALHSAYPLALRERLERIAYIGEDRCVADKYVRGIRCGLNK